MFKMFGTSVDGCLTDNFMLIGNTRIGADKSLTGNPMFMGSRILKMGIQ